MTNSKLLKEYLKRSGLKTSFIAEQLGLTRQGFWKKIQSGTTFKVDEYEKLGKLLNLSNKEQKAVFLSPDVDETGTK